MTWTLAELNTLLNEQNRWKVNLSTHQDSLTVTQEDGLIAYIAVAGEQILIETLLFSISQVKDVAEINQQILRTQKLFPLTSIGLNKVGNEDFYSAFGALSTQSKSESIIIEVSTLFNNVEAIMDMYSEYLEL